MPTITDIQFRDNPPHSGGNDYLKISFHFEEMELNQLYLILIKYKRVSPRSENGPWNNLPDRMIRSATQDQFIEMSPNISADTGFQQSVKFMIGLIEITSVKESILFPINL